MPEQESPYVILSNNLLAEIVELSPRLEVLEAFDLSMLLPSMITPKIRDVVCGLVLRGYLAEYDAIESQLSKSLSKIESALDTYASSQSEGALPSLLKAQTRLKDLERRLASCDPELKIVGNKGSCLPSS